MRQARSIRWDLCVLLLVLAAVVLPYRGLATGSQVLVTDDSFTSDVWSAGIPARAALGRTVRAGEWPTWEPGILGGVPWAAGAFDPFTLAASALLPPHVAYGLPLLVWLALMSAGAFLLARRLGAGLAGAALAGLVFPLSGAVITHLKHYEIVETECWTPWALLALEAAIGAGERRARVRAFALFALVFGLQILAGFLQTAYFAGLAYVVWIVVAAARGAVQGDRRRAFELLVGFGVACLVAIAIGAMGMLPTGEVARASARGTGVPWEFAAGHPYWVPDLWTFLDPTAHGNVADGTYTGTGIFWEDYAYAGLATVLLAPLGIYAGRRDRRFLTLALGGLVALLLVLGPATPLFRLAFEFFPGMGRFRFPTRFLFLVELALALLAARGLALVMDALSQRSRARGAIALGVVVVLATMIDLLIAQRPQNALADAKSWMTPPDTARQLSAIDGEPFRIYTPLPMTLHRNAFQHARGWADLEPLFVLRDVIEPNTNQLWGLEAGSGYDVLAPHWADAYWGDFGTPGLVASRVRPLDEQLDFRTSWPKLLALANVRFVVSAWSIDSPRLKLVSEGPVARLYELSDTLPRAYVASRANVAADDREAVGQMLSDAFQPGTDVVLSSPLPSSGSGGTARITARRTSEVSVHTSGGGGILVLADTWFPGWAATIDGAATELVRANLWQRAVAVPAGEHDVRFTFALPSARRGRWLTLAGFLLVGLLLVVTVRRSAG